MFTNAKDVVEMIEQRKNRGYGLAHFQSYMETLGNPQNQLKAIHVAGTNGKGSTTNDLRSVLQTAGYRVGTFTSPYMISHYDRIRINDVFIPEDMFLEISNTYYASWMEWDLGMFEIDMCIAVLYFLKENVDICVFEVGLGGRLDATNILIPLVSVITNIGMDHMEYLGDTKAKIAKEKAGIVKLGIDLITGEHDPICLDVFQENVKQAHSQLLLCGKEEHVTISEEGVRFDYKEWKEIQLSSLAKYQCKNALLCIEVITYLCNKGQCVVSETAMREGLRKANWIGRFEVIRETPLLLLDGAHNAHGIKALVESLQGRKNLRVIFSVLKDKNFEEMLTRLEGLTTDIVVTPFYNERALDMRILEKKMHVRYDGDYRHAIQEAMREGKNVVVTGSLYFISEVRKYITEKENE